MQPSPDRPHHLRAIRVLLYATTDGQLHFNLDHASEHQLSLNEAEGMPQLSAIEDALEEPMFIYEPTPAECDAIRAAVVVGSIAPPLVIVPESAPTPNHEETTPHGDPSAINP